jgi:hypothetical protein
MALRNAFDSLATETTNLTQTEVLTGMLAVLAAMLETLPRVDANNRVLVNASEVNPTVAIAAAQTLATVTTLTTCSTVSSVSDHTNLGGRSASNMVYGNANAGCLHIYNNIVVTA